MYSLRHQCCCMFVRHAVPRALLCHAHIRATDVLGASKHSVLEGKPPGNQWHCGCGVPSHSDWQRKSQFHSAMQQHRLPATPKGRRITGLKPPCPCPPKQGQQATLKVVYRGRIQVPTQNDVHSMHLLNVQKGRRIRVLSRGPCVTRVQGSLADCQVTTQLPCGTCSTAANEWQPSKRESTKGLLGSVPQG